MERFTYVFGNQVYPCIKKGRDLFEKNASVKKLFNKVDEILESPLSETVFYGKDIVLLKLENANPAILTISYAIFKVYMMELNVWPSCMIGIGCGEITAIVCAGGLRFEDAIKLVKIHGKLMDETAKINSEEKKMTTDFIADKFETELQKYEINDLIWPIFSSVGGLLKNKEEVYKNLSNLIINPMRWEKIIDFLSCHSIDNVLEIGLEAKYLDIFKQQYKEIKLFSLVKQDDFMNKITNHKEKRIEVFLRCLANAVATPCNNNIDDDSYQNGVVKPYRKMEYMLEQIEKVGKEPTVKQIEEVLILLKTIFMTKLVSEEQQMIRFETIINETGISKALISERLV